MAAVDRYAEFDRVSGVVCSRTGNAESVIGIHDDLVIDIRFECVIFDVCVRYIDLAAGRLVFYQIRYPSVPDPLFLSVAAGICPEPDLAFLVSVGGRDHLCTDHLPGIIAVLVAPVELGTGVVIRVETRSVAQIVNVFHVVTAVIGVIVEILVILCSGDLCRVEESVGYRSVKGKDESHSLQGRRPRCIQREIAGHVRSYLGTCYRKVLVQVP